MKQRMGKCKSAWHYKAVCFWQVSLQRVAGGLLDISMNELEETPPAKPADNQKVATSIKLGMSVILSDLVPWEHNPSKQGMDFTAHIGLESAGTWGIRSFPKLWESRGRSSCLVSGKADPSITPQSGRSMLTWDADQEPPSERESPCLLLGSVNQEGR